MKINKKLMGSAILWIMGIVGILVIASVVGLYFYRKDNYYSQKSSVTPSVTQTQKEENSDWKIYKNTKYGFEIRHPNIWKILEEQNGDWIRVCDSSISTNISTCPFSIRMMELTTDTIDSWISKNIPFSGNSVMDGPFSVIRAGEMTVDGHKVIITQTTGDGGQSLSYYLVDNGKVFRMGDLIDSSLSLKDINDQGALFGKILNTLKF